MSKKSIDGHHKATETYKGNELCRQKTIKLLEELNMPWGLLPIQDKALNYTFRKAGHLVSFIAKVTGFVEDHRMCQVTGTKTKELPMWISLGEFYVNPRDSSKITFRTPTGLSKMYPTSAFEVKEHRSIMAVA
ncbi:uncharacterized protein LOC144705979 [Wolffia australiana]